MTCLQNLARDRAKAFGLDDQPSAALHIPRGHLLPTPSSSVIVSTAATEALGEEEVVMSPKQEEELRAKPRGFFADQFEVRTDRSMYVARYLNARAEQEQLRGALRWDWPGDLEADEWTCRCIRLGRRCVRGYVPCETDVADGVAGTGGTIAGTGQFLKSMNEDVLVVLADPEGSGLYNKV